MVFDEASHTYTYRGVVVEKSCTALVSQNFEHFDAWGTVTMFYERWKHNQDDRYWDIIGLTHETADESRIDDYEAQRRIVARWEGLGADAACKGTLLHTYCERSFNRAPTDPPISLNGFEDIVQEVVQHDAFMRSDIITEHALRPYATELLVWYTINGHVVSAGQVDAVMRSSDTGEFYLFDWKRVSNKHELTAWEQPFAGRQGVGECAEIPDTHFHKYSLQCSIYGIMLGHSRGIGVGNRMYLVRVHEDRETYQVVECCDWRPVAQSLLQAEHERLMAKRTEMLVV